MLSGEVLVTVENWYFPIVIVDQGCCFPLLVNQIFGFTVLLFGEWTLLGVISILSQSFLPAPGNFL